MIQHLCPKLLKFLTVFKEKETKKDISAFEIPISRLVRILLTGIFTRFVGRAECLRIWDLGLMTGFEFWVKTCVWIVKRHEKTLLTALKTLKKDEKKKKSKDFNDLNFSDEDDFLLKAANSVIRNLLKSNLVDQVELMIKECMQDDFFNSFSRRELLSTAALAIKSENFRRKKIQETRTRLKNELFDKEKYEKLLNSLKGFSEVSREKFLKICSEFLQISLKNSENWFNTLDIQGNNSLSLSSLPIFLSLFLPSKEDQIISTFFQGRKEKISLKDFVSYLVQIENFLDPFSDHCFRSFKSISSEITETFGDSLTKNQVLSIFNSNFLFIQFVPLLEPDEAFFVLNTKDELSTSAEVAVKYPLESSENYSPQLPEAQKIEILPIPKTIQSKPRSCLDTCSSCKLF
jgi:hypothetical protein